MNTKLTLIKLLTTLFIVFSFKLALAVVPSTLNYQGHLTDSAGVPIDGPVNMVFSLYDLDAGGTALWSDLLSVTVNQGVFSIELGEGAAPFPSGLFENPLWIGLAIATDKEMSPRRPISSTGFSFKAGDADTLEGVRVSTLDQSVHITDTANPHSVTAAQTGAADAATLSSHIGNTANPHSVTAAQTGATSSDSFTLHTGDAGAHHSKTSNYSELTGTVDDIYIDSTITRDSELAGHSASQSVHHARYIDSEAVAAIKAADGAGSNLDADKVDGLQASEIIDAAQDEVRTPISSLPYPINQSGSYYLTGNLDGSSGGIDITTDDVTLDLMGFTIDGGTVNDYGIYFTMYSNITIINGTIKSFGLAGIYQGPSPYGRFATVRDVKSLGNGTLGTEASHSGIYLRGFSNVERCTAGDNGGTGIYTDTSSKLIDNTAYNNTGDYGIRGGTSSVLKGNTAYANTVIYGINGGAGSSMSDNTAFYNTGDSSTSYGIFGSAGSSLINNTSYDNDCSGIYGGSGSILSGNSTYSNTGSYGIYGSTGSAISGNTASFNSFYGIFGSTGTNLTGNSAYYNTGIGIYGHGNAIISGNTSYYNRGAYGIYGDTGASLSGNNVYFNSHWGIYGVGSNLIENNVLNNNNTSVTANEGGLHVGADSRVTGNTLDNNLRNNIYVESSDSVLKDNHTTDSTYGIYFVSGVNAFFNNTASGNTIDFVNGNSQTTNTYLPNISF